MSNKPYQPALLLFFTHSFSKMVYYDVGLDGAFYSICCKAMNENKVKTSATVEPAFLVSRFTNWNDTPGISKIIRNLAITDHVHMPYQIRLILYPCYQVKKLLNKKKPWLHLKNPVNSTFPRSPRPTFERRQCCSGRSCTSELDFVSSFYKI